MKKYDLKKLLKKYNDYFTKRYGCETDLLEEGITGALDSIEAVQSECVCDGETAYKECDFLKKYFYYKYIEKDIDYFKKIDKEIK